MGEQATLDLLATMNASFTVQNLVQGIHEFDGRNIPLKDFLQDIRNGAQLVPAAQRKDFTRLIITKLRGPARDTTYGKEINTPDELIKILKQRFAPCRDFAYYNSKIHSSRMKQGDMVGDFYDRLNILLSCAENALKEELGNSYDEAMMTPIKNSTVRIFINGLPKEIGNLVDVKQPKTLEEAYKEALRIETRINLKPKPNVDFSRLFGPNRTFNDEPLNSDGARLDVKMASPREPTRAPGQPQLNREEIKALVAQFQ